MTGAMIAPLRYAAALALLATACHQPHNASSAGGVADDDSVRLVLLGDSNTDAGWSGTEPRAVVRSYVSDGPPRVAPQGPHSPLQLAGKIERQWRSVAGAPPIRVVNHGISGTTTGGGGHGGKDRNPGGSPNARTPVNGVTRYEGEVLGAAYPWSGGEPVSLAFPTGAIRGVNALVRGPNDFAYVSLGTNDLANDGVPPVTTLENLTWMVDRWIAAGHAPDHLILTTLAPRLDRDLGDAIPTINAGIRALAARRGTGLVDLAAVTSPDDGRSWRSAALHVGDRLHYSEAVRDSLAARIGTYRRAHVAAARADDLRR
jgi:lysophospholipase L1-like esterase